MKLMQLYANRAYSVLKDAFSKHNFRLMVQVTDNPTLRSMITTLSLDHVALQTVAMLNFYLALVGNLDKELELLSAPWGGETTCNPVGKATASSAFAGRVSERTIRRWRKDFESHGHRFTEDGHGKHICKWILDNKLMVGQAKAWLKASVGRRAKKGQAFFQIRDF